jgi:hypothetical protein
MKPQIFTVTATREHDGRTMQSEQIEVFADYFGKGFTASHGALGMSKKYATPEHAVRELLRAAGFSVSSVRED